MQRTGAVRLGELLNQYIDEVRIRDGFVSLDVCGAWRAAVGPRAAAATAYAINARLGSPLVHRIILR